MSNVYGYARISTAKQNMTRQIRNILALEPSAKIYQEIFTGTKTTGRNELNKLLKEVKSNDTIIFDSVSRMSRNADEGFELYKKLFEQGVNLVFINESYINTDTYKQAREKQVSKTGAKADKILDEVNDYLMELAAEQIKLSFEQSQRETDDLSERTKQVLETARLNGIQLGRQKGVKVRTKKSEECKKKIKQHCKAFGGTVTDKDLIVMLHINRNTYYKYKRELLEGDEYLLP